MKKMKNSTKRKVSRMLQIITLMSILGLVISFIGFRISVKEVELENLQETIRQKTKHKLTDLDQLINEMVSDLEETAKIINEYDDFSHEDIKGILQLSNQMNWFDYTGIADAEGNGYDNAGNIVNVSDREYFQTAMQGQVAFSDVLPSKVIEGDRVQIIAHPVRAEHNEIRGVVFGILDVEHFSKIISPNGRQENNNLYIVDSCGAYIGEFQETSYFTSNENFWLDLAQMDLDSQTISQLKSDFENRKKGEFSYSYGDEQYYACYSPIGPNRWQLVYSISDSSADKIVQSIYYLDAKNTAFALICYLMLMSCLIWYFKQSQDRILKTNREAKRNMEYMHIAMEHSKNIVFEYDQKNRVIRLKTDNRNPLFCCSVMTYVPECFIALNVVVPESIRVVRKLFQTIATEVSCQDDIEIISNGEKIWYRITLQNIYDEKNMRIGTVGVVEDISEQKRREAEIRKKLQIQDALIANSLSYGKVNVKTGMLLELNGEEMRVPFQDFMQKMIREKVLEEHIAYVEQKLSLESLQEACQQGKEIHEIQFLFKYGSGYKWVSCTVYQILTDEDATVIFVFTDIDDRKRSEIALKQQAERDGLTGLYNATKTRSKIDRILSQNNTLDETHIFILLDLDNYKQINDTFGHGYGDQVLIDVANTLNTRFRSSDIVGRLGGDEFIIFLRNIRSYDYAEHLIDELCRSIQKTYREGDKEVILSASIGIALAPMDGKTFEELYKKSDIAQYQVKNHGKNGFKRYHS